MRAKYGDTVKVKFTCRLGDGTVFDTSDGREPLSFTIGGKQVIEGLEQAVIGMDQGESKTVAISSDKAFGPRLKEKIHVISRDQFPKDFDPQVGFKFEIDQSDGVKSVVTVTDLTESKVTLDANHPLSDKDLSFDIEIIEITESDISKAEKEYLKGVEFQDKDFIDDAMSCYQKAIKLNPDHAGAYFNLGVALQKKGQLDNAIFCYKIATLLPTDCAEAHHNLGIVLKEKGDIDGAINSFQRAIEINPGYASTHSSLGAAFQKKGQLDEAINCYQKAIEINPSDAAAYFNMGTALQEKGELERAIENYQQALHLNPELFRQHAPGDWESVMERAKDELQMKLKSRS